MKKITKIALTAGVLVTLLYFAYPLKSFAQEPGNNCVTCHADLDETLALPAGQRNNDIHFTRGIMCVDCHGGDSQIDHEGDFEAAMDPQKGFVGAISRTEIPQFCDRCHGNANYMKSFNPNIHVDQYQRYKTSVHGQKLAEGDENVAVCTDCHAIHKMRNINDPASQVYPLHVSDTCGKCHSDDARMQDYGIPTDQVELYKSSVHYEFLEERGDLTAPTCNDCHGNHGAAPPGVDNINLVCGVCHISNKDLYIRSPHFQAFQDMDMPACVTCHSNHEILYTGEFMLTPDDGVCWMCHDVESEQGRTILAIESEIESLKHLGFQADSLISLAELKGMEVSEYKFELLNLTSKLHIARNLVHSFSLETIREETRTGRELAETIIEGGNGALAEIGIRRTGLLLSLIFIFLVIIGLYLKIKAIPRNE